MPATPELKRHLPTLLTGLSLALVACLLWLWSKQFELIEYSAIREKNSVQINELYAAEIFLQKRQHPVESLSSANKLIDSLPDSKDLIIYHNDKERLANPARREALLNWVKSGGHLLIAAPEDRDNDPLFDELGVKKKSIRSYIEEQNQADDTESGEESDNGIGGVGSTAEQEEDREQQQCIPKPEELMTRVPEYKTRWLCELLDVNSTVLTGSVQLHFCTDHYLYDSQERGVPLAIDAWGLPHLLQFELGEGRVLMAEDLGFLTNEKILYFDHAYYLSQLAHGRNKIWLLYQGHSESLLQFLWRHAAFAMVLCMLLLALYLWRHIPRFGSLIHAPLPARRQLIEHIDASAHFRWTHHEMQSGLERLQQTILLDAARIQGRHKVDFEQDVQWLAQQTKLAESEIRSSLSAPLPAEPLEFLALIKILFQLRTLP